MTTLEIMEEIAQKFAANSGISIQEARALLRLTLRLEVAASDKERAEALARHVAGVRAFRGRK